MAALLKLGMNNFLHPLLTMGFLKIFIPEISDAKQEMPRWLAAVKAFDDGLELSDW